MTNPKPFDLRQDFAYLPQSREQIPLPHLYDKMKDNSHQWSTCYPAWNLQYFTCLASLKRHRPDLIVETGTNHGCSAALLAQTLRETELEGHVLTFELDPVRAETAQALFVKLGLADLITIVIGDCREKLVDVVRDRPVDFAFIDADHRTESCVAETEILLDNVIAGEGKFYFDNTGCGPVDVALCILKGRHGTSGWVDFPNVSRHPPGKPSGNHGNVRSQLSGTIRNIPEKRNSLDEYARFIVGSFTVGWSSSGEGRSLR